MPTSRDRVPSHTRDDVNRRIRRRTARNVHYYSTHRDQISRRLRQLDREWDIERAIEANAATLGFVGVALGTVHDRRWLALPDQHHQQRRARLQRGCGHGDAHRRRA